MEQDNQRASVSTGTTNNEAPAIPAAGTSVPQPSNVEIETHSTREHPAPEDGVKPPEGETSHGTRKQALERLRREAELEVQGHLTSNRVDNHRLLKEMEDVPGKEDYSPALLQVIQSYGIKGVHASELHESFPDPKKLTEARKKLAAANCITAEKKANSWLLKAVS